jgi:hypothetical protein
MTFTGKQSDNDDGAVIEKCIHRELNNIFKMSEISGDYLLDMSPIMSVQTVLLASKRFKNIIFGNKTDNERNEIVKWLEKKENLFSNDTLEYVKSLENEMNLCDYGSNEDIEESTRRSIRAVMNVLQTDCWLAKFDCVLIVANESYLQTGLNDLLERLIGLLDKHGCLIVCGCYSLGNEAFFLNDTVQALLSNDLDILRLSTSDNDDFTCFSITACRL